MFALFSPKSILNRCTPCYHNEEQEVGVPEWESEDKGEGKNGEFRCVFALRFSKLNLTLVERDWESFKRRWEGARGREGKAGE